MVAIVVGKEQGLERTSAFLLGSSGQLGSAAFGRFGENVTVNAVNGNLIINRTDEILIGQGPDSVISRTYNSSGTLTGFGTSDNWRLNAQRYVTSLTGTVNTAGSQIKLIGWDGTGAWYAYNTTLGKYVNMEGGGAYDTLAYSSGTNQWTWTDGDTQAVDVFDNANGGRIISSKDTDNNQLTYTYTGSNLTRVTVTDASGAAEHTDLTWSGSNLTQIVTTLQSGATLTRTRYTYDASNRLSTVTTDLTPGDNSVTDGNTVVTTYTYDGTSGRVASIAQTGGALLSITYDASLRVASIAQTLASGVTNTTTFSYNTSTRVTTITDQQGQVTTMAYDTSSRLTQITLPAAQSGATAQSLSFTYNANGDVLTKTDGSGNVTTYAYDSNGNATLVRDQAGNTVARTYDSTNHLLTETRYFTPDPDGSGSGQPSGSFTTRYAYTSTGDLHFAVSGLGEVTEYVRNAAGQVTSTIVYRGATYSLSGLSDSTAISESSLNSWVSGISDKSNIQRADTTYDFRGNVSTVKTYTAANSSGAGLTTSPYTTLTYTYDQFGNLLTRATSGISNTEVFTYDGLGRIVSSTDLNGASTSIAFTDSSNQMVATLANGLVKTSVYNLAGELISYAQSGSGITTGTTSYAYDAVGQLRMVTDATGNKTYYLYDYVGRKVADIAADGSITEYRYDQSDRLVSTTSYATQLTGTQVSSLVSGGAPATVLLSTIRPSANAADVWTWRIYDTANRLIETIDGDGDVVVFAYDGASNLVSTTAYANVLAAATVTGFKTTAPTSLQTPTADSAHDIVTRNFYDNDSRLIATLNGDGYLTQVKYDEAGEKVETIASATVTVAAHRASGTLATLLTDVGTSSSDLHTHYVYDGEGNLKYTLDANLRPTEYVYDNAGHLLHTKSYAAPIASAPSSYTVANVAAQIAATSGLATNAANRTSWAVYDAAGRVAYTIDADGGVVAFVYDAVGQVIKKIAYVTLDPVSSDQSLSTMNSWATTHASDTGNRLTRVIYDQAGRVVYTVDAEGYVTENRYDAAGRVTLNIRYAAVYSVSDGATPASMATLIGGSIPSTAVQTSFTYDVDGRVVDSYDGAGVRTHYVYDALGRVTDTTVAYGTSDAATTHYVYDAAGRRISQTNAYGTAEATTSSCTYDGLGNILTETDGRGYVTTYTYDNLGLVKTVTAPIDASNTAVTTNYYDAFGNVIQTNDARGNNSYFFYDKLNRLTYQIDGEGYVTKTDYTIGNEVAQITHYATKVTGTITAGTLPTITTAAGDEVTGFTRNLLGQVTKVTDAEGYYEQYTLDAFGNQVTVRNKLGGITTNVFDRRGLLVSETKAETSVRANNTTEATSVTNTYQYDSRGNRTQMVEAAGLTEQRITNYTYDKMDRLTARASGDAITIMANNLSGTSSVYPSVTYQYDSRGNLILTTDEVGAKTFSYYDHLNRQIATVNAVGTLSVWTYDANGNATSQKVYGDAVTLPGSPGGSAPSPVNGSNYRETDYAYDRANRLTTTTVANVQYGYYNGSAFVQGTTSLIITNTYDKAGNIISQQDARGNNVYYYYDKRGAKVAEVDQGRYLTYYTLDADGNVTKEERFATALASAPSTSSDPATLRSSVAGNANDRITNFTYDRNGRRLTEQRTGITAYTVNSSGTLASASTNATITYTYNGLGEVLTKTEATGDQTTYTYDNFGRQSRVSTASYTDYNGTTVTPTTWMSYDGLNNLTISEVAELGRGGNILTTRNTYGAGGRLASSTDASGFTSYFYYDAAGRVIAQTYYRTKSDGSLTWPEAKVTNYDALGRTVFKSVAAWNGSSYVFGDYQQTQYNTFGEVTAKGANGLWQETTSYDNAGHAWKTTSGDGVTKIFYYDQNGNQTAEVTSDGNALPSGYSWSSLTIAQVNSLETAGGGFGSAAVNGMVLTYKTYDARGQNLSVVEPLRQINFPGTNYTITKQHGYNAFGEVTSDTDARGYVTNYSYNTLGKLVQTQNPSVNVTAESGAISATNPLQVNYYDLSGRLVAVQDANGNITKRFLLAGTGYGGTEASVVKEFHPDGGVKSFGFDVFGNQRKATDELGNVTLMDYDAMGRLTTVTHPTRAAGSAGNLSGSAQTLIDYYLYDELGQRIAHWNNVYTSTTKDRTDYDTQGRVVQSIDMAGHVTSQSYSWNASINTAIYGGGSLGTFGGWVESTTSAAGLTSTTTVDYFNRNISKSDFGGNSSSFSYNLAGQLANQTLTSAEHIEYRYYNTGQLKSIDDITVTYNYNPSHYYDAGTNTTSTDYSYYTNYYVPPTYHVSYYDSWGNPVYESNGDDTYDGYYEIKTHTTGVSNYYFTEVYTTNTVDHNTGLEYDLDGNRTYEGSIITNTNVVATTYTTDTTSGTTYHFYTDHAGHGINHTPHYYSTQVPDYGAYTYYTNDWVSDAYSYTDSCYGQTIYAWPATGSYQAADPTTYHTEYYWVEDGETYYDNCYGSSYFYDYGYGHYVGYQVADPTTYHTVYYTYTAYGYSDPGTYGHYVTNAHTGYQITGYHTEYGTYYTDDYYSFDYPTYADNYAGATNTHYVTSSTAYPTPSTTWLEAESVTYDAMNRITSIHDAGYGQAAPTTINFEYDANGNTRRRDALYRALDAAGNIASTDSEQDNWYKYDSMNRFVTTKGVFTGSRGSGTISRGADGTDLSYDAAGNRATATTTMNDGTVRQEQYVYTADGFLAAANVSMNGGSANPLAAYGLDVMGRTTSYMEYNGSGTNTYTRTASYDQISQVTHDDTTTVRSDGTYYASTDYSYVAQSGTASGVASGAYLGGVLVHSHTTNSHVPTGGSLTTDASTDYTNTYIMRDSAQISSSTYVSDSTQVVHHAGYWENWTNSYSATWHDAYDEVVGSATAWVSNYYYDAQGHLQQVNINDGQPRTVTYITNMMGEVMKRDVSYTAGGNAPHELHYYLAGMAIGDVTNNGTSNTDYVTSVAARVATSQGYGPFRNGSSDATPYADFDQSYDPINGYDSTSTASNYVIKPGDTLQSIARSLWGDANLWYLIAQANGLNANSTLPVGMSIVIPNNQVHNFHNSSSTFKVYDPNLGIGDVSPTAPEIPPPPPPPAPPVQQSHGHGGCGFIGQIIKAVISIVVTVVATPFVGPVAGAMLGDAAGQVFGLATGMQSGFNWKELGMTAVTAGVTQGLNTPGVFGETSVFDKLGIGGAAFGEQVAQGAISNAVSQGIGVATGLQSKFDWAGVAAAGVSNGVVGWAGQKLGFDPNVSGDWNNSLRGAVTGVAGGIANAATRSLINGSDFGDNIIAGLPDVLAQTVGNQYGEQIRASVYGEPSAQEIRMTATDQGLSPEQEKDMEARRAQIWADMQAEADQYAPTVGPLNIDASLPHIDSVGEKPSVARVAVSDSDVPVPTPRPRQYSFDDLPQIDPTVSPLGNGIIGKGMQAIVSGAAMEALEGEGREGAWVATENELGLGTPNDPGAGAVLREWRTGTGPATRVFDPSSGFSQEFANAPSTQSAVQSALDFWVNRRDGGLKGMDGENDHPYELSGFPLEFGPKEFVEDAHPLNGAAHVIGSARLDATLDGNTVLWRATNDMGLHSFFAGNWIDKGAKWVGAPKSIPYGVPNIDHPLPFGTTRQVIEWRTDLSGKYIPPHN